MASFNQIIDNKVIPFLAFILGVAICTSTALMSAFYSLLAIAVFFTSDFRAKIKLAMSNNYIVACLLFYLMFILGIIWSVAPLHSVFEMLLRIVGYLLAPLFLIAYQTNNSGRLLLNGFIIGALVSSLLSIISFLFNHHILYGVHDQTWVVFHGHILHNAFLAVASAFLLWQVFEKSSSNSQRLMFALAYLICLVDILFIVNGRTGQIMVLIINAFLVLFRFKLRGTLLLLLAVIIIAPLLWISPIIQKGLYNYRHDISQYEQGNHWTSYGARKEFHKQSIKLIKDKPILGYGTGSFGKVYKAQNEMRHEPITSNPHRDILWIGVELGVVGICLFIYMLFSFIFACLKLDNLYYKCMGLSLIIGYIVASTENSFFIDNVTGMAFIFIILAILSTKIKIK